MSASTNHVGHKPHRPQPHRPHENTILATMNNHIGHRNNVLLLASTFKSYPFETRNVVCNPVSRKWRVKELNNCRSIQHFKGDLMRVLKSLSDRPLPLFFTDSIGRLTDSFGN